MHNDPLEQLSQANSSNNNRSSPSLEDINENLPNRPNPNISPENLALNVIINRQQYLYLFEELISDIGYGEYQKRIEILLGVLMFLNGIEIIVIALSITDFLLNENFNENLIIFISSVIFIGFSVGSIFSKILWNRFGYKRSLLTTLLLYNLISLMSVYPFALLDFVIFRAICAILMNLVKNFGYNLLVEYTFPMKAVQETYFNYYCYYVHGQAISCAFILILHDYDPTLDLSNFYQLLIKATWIICACSYFLIRFYVMESIKYSLYWNRYSQAFNAFNNLAEINKGRSDHEYLDELKKSSLTYWTELYVVQMEAQSNISIWKKFRNIYNNTDDTQKLFSILLIVNSMIITLTFYSFPLVAVLFEVWLESENNQSADRINLWCVLFIINFSQYLGLLLTEIFRKTPAINKISLVLLANSLIIVCSLLIYGNIEGYTEIFMWIYSILNAFLFSTHNEMKGYFFNSDIKETAKEVIKFMENMTFLLVPFVFWSNLLFSYNYIFVLFSVLYIFNLFIVLGLFFYEKWRMQIEILIHEQH